MKWFGWKSFASRSVDKSSSLQDLLRPPGDVTDAWNRSANFNCAASMRPRRYLGCGSRRPPLCNSDKPDEMIVRPELAVATTIARRRLCDRPCAMQSLISSACECKSNYGSDFTTKRLAGLTELVRSHLETD